MVLRTPTKMLGTMVLMADCQKTMVLMGKEKAQTIMAQMEGHFMTMAMGQMEGHFMTMAMGQMGESSVATQPQENPQMNIMVHLLENPLTTADMVQMAERSPMASMVPMEALAQKDAQVQGLTTCRLPMAADPARGRTC